MTLRISDNMKAGYVGHDAMRAKAEKMLGSYKESAKTYSENKTARPYAGGSTPAKEAHERKELKEARGEHKGEHKHKVQKFALGGVGKIRHEEANSKGMPLHPAKKSYKANM